MDSLSFRLAWLCLLLSSTQRGLVALHVDPGGHALAILGRGTKPSAVVAVENVGRLLVRSVIDVDAVAIVTACVEDQLWRFGIGPEEAAGIR